MKRKFTVCLARMACLNGLAMIVLATATGCTGLNHWCGELRGCVSNQMVDYSNRALAERAWIQRKERYCNFQYQQEFKDGFITGYLNVANGGDGCTPTIAPEKYWGWAYQTPHGQAAITNFFQGFPFGAKAAEEDGVGYWSAIPTSGLDGLVPYSDTAPAAVDENILPVPVPVIESAAASASKKITGINQPITSPSDEESNAEFFELVDSTSTTPSIGPTPSGNVDTQPAVSSEAGIQESEVAVPPSPEASTNTSQPELTFTFE